MNNVLSILETFGVLILVLFLPGLCLSYVFFWERKIDALERTVGAFALSIACVPLILFYLNLLGIPITRAAVLSQIILIGIGTGTALILKIWLKKQKGKDE